MNNNLIDLLNSTIILEEKKPLIIEVFVSYYGEEIREEFTKKVNDVFIIGYQPIDDKIRILRTIKDGKENELLSSLFEKYNLELTDDNKKHFIGYGHLGDKYTDINKCGELMIQSHLGVEGRHQTFIKKNYEYLKRYLPNLSLDTMLEYSKNGIPEEFLSIVPPLIKEDIESWFDRNQDAEAEFQKLRQECLPLLQKLMPNITEEDLSNSNTINAINMLYQDYLHCVDEYQAYVTQFAEVQNEIDDARKLEDNLKQKHTIAFIDEIIDIFPTTIQEKYQIEKQKESFTIYNLPEIQNIIGHSLESPLSIEIFSKENEELLQRDNSWRKKSLIDDRIRYFKKNGIDLGEEYENYANHPNCQKIWPSQEMIEHISRIQKTHLNAFYDEYYNSLPAYQNQRSQIDALNLLDKEDGFTADIYQKTPTKVMPNIKFENGTYQGKNIMLIHTGPDNEYLDKNIIHEFNHLFELSEPKISGNTYELTCGWDILTGRFNQETNSNTKQEEGKRTYELFNEIINETIAQEIASNMHSQGIYLFNTKDKCTDFGGSSYQRSFPIVKDFLEKYKTPIIESRRNGNIQAIFDVIGKENYEALNNLLNDFYLKFPGHTYYSLMQDLREQKNTSLTQAYVEIINQKDIIMNAMEMQSEKHM